ncbi:MAG: hypothetical protein HPY59_14030 [Anaerolineae bacterium]|nr:hypothetical protein [Anaerolineae bacterium]
MNVEESPSGNSTVTQITIQMNAGSLNLKGGGAKAVEGTIQYNIPEWEPQLIHTDNKITIQQKPELPLQIPSAAIINKWDLALGKSPIELSVHANAYKGEINLSGVPLRKLEFKDSASDNELIFEEYNPETLELITYTTSASTATLRGLGFANFTQMNFDASAGSYTLDFAGKLQQPASVTIVGGGCNIKLIIPKGTASIIENNGTTTTVDVTRGSWNIDQNVYKTEGESPLLTIKVEIGAGRLELIQQ